MRQRGENNSKKMRSVAASVRVLVSVSVVLFFLSPQLSAEELLKSPSAFDDFGKFDESKVEKWKELESPLPAYPDNQHLVRAHMPITYTLDVYIDEKSVSLLKDGVTRFTLVVETQSGGRNVFFEGYNCDTQEYKTYATGVPGGTFEPLKKPSWQRVQYYDVNAFRFQLLRYYVCDPDLLSTALTPDALIRRLKDLTSP